MQESPIFLKSFEMIEWLLQHTRKFPKDQRFVMAKRMEDAVLSFHDEILWATKERSAAPLRAADFHLERLKVYNRLAMKLKLSSFGQYEHLARMLDEIGRLLGGWMRKSKGFAGDGTGTTISVSVVPNSSPARDPGRHAARSTDERPRPGATPRILAR